MKRFGTLAVACTLFGIATMLFFSMGCESADGVSSLTVSPSTATLSGNTRAQIFRVTQASNAVDALAFPITWRVSDSSLGSVQAADGSACVYYRSGVVGENIIIAEDQYGNEGYATVVQQ